MLVGPGGPLLVDAECASWGDPAFDVAFCANHLLLKAVWRPELAAALRGAFDAFTSRYLVGVAWEPVLSTDHDVVPETIKAGETVPVRSRSLAVFEEA